ncbi:MAG TPA: ParB/RepB/Spo0J family partition protein [Arcobacter sp.]|nr:ParB/RepB/Spo0J family partition protein [Arcobacter sp.]
MAKRKINAAMILAAGEDAHLQTKAKVSHAKSIGGETFLELNVEDIQNNPMQPRIYIGEDELKDLARSIKLHGLIQPIAVVRVGESDYILKAGQRRWLAHKALGLKTIKAIVQEETILPKKENEKALFEIAVMENTQRDNLNPLELALSLRQAMDKNLYKSMEELALALSKSKSYVSKVLKVLSLEDEIIKDLAKNKSTNDIESLYEIQKIKDIKEQVRVYFDFIAKKIDRKGLRALNKAKNKVSHAKVNPYKIESRAKKVKVEFDVSDFTDNQITEINERIKNILNEYF